MPGNLGRLETLGPEGVHFEGDLGEVACLEGVVQRFGLFLHEISPLFVVGAVTPELGEELGRVEVFGQIETGQLRIQLEAVETFLQ